MKSPKSGMLFPPIFMLSDVWRCADEAAGGRGLMAPCPLAMAVLLEQEQEGSLRSSQEALIKGSPEGALLKGAHIPTIVMVALS